MRRGLISGFIFVVFAVIFAIPLFSQVSDLFLFYLPHTAYDPQDYTARTFAMGGLTTASAGGAEAVISNPAGMGFNIASTEVLLTGGAHLMGKPQQNEKDVYKDAGFDKYSNKHNFRLNLSNFSTCSGYRMKDVPVGFAGGAAVRRYYDWGAKFTEETDIGGVETETEVSMSGVLNFLAVAGAVCYDDKYSGGLMLGFRFMSHYTAEFESKSDGYEYKYKEEYDASGSLFRFGGLIKPVPMIALGLAYTGGFDLEGEDGEWEAEYDGIKDDGELPDGEYEIPGYLSLGFTFSPNSVVMLGIDYQTRPWEDYTDDDGNELADNNGFTLRFGGSLNMGAVALRAGYIMDKGPWEDKDRDLITVNTITGGMGFGNQTFTLDFGIGYSFASSDGAYGITDEDMIYNVLKAKISATYRFPLFWGS